MFQQSNHPSLKQIVAPANLPEELGFLEQGLDTLLSSVLLENFQRKSSSSGDIVAIYGNLVFFEDASLEIPGTGLRLIIHDSNQSGKTEAPISIQLELRHRKIIRNFSIDNFDFSNKSFFEVLCMFSQLSGKRLLRHTITFYTVDGEVESLIDRINDEYYPSVLSNKIQPIGSNFEEKLNNLYQELLNNPDFENQNISLYDIIYQVFIVKGFASQEEELAKFFRGQYFEKPIEKIKRVLLPSISAQCQIEPGVEVPNDVLKPVDENIDKTLLLFGSIRFRYSTRLGLQGLEDTSVSLNEPSKIAGTDFTIDFNTAKVDLSDNSTLPEISAAGYKKDFKGVFIQSATIGLPPFLVEDGNNPSIKGKDLIIGTGGFSGTLALDAGEQLSLKLGSTEGFSLSLNQFSLTFQQNAIIGSSIFGTLTLPGFKDETGNPAEIGIEASFTSDGDFAITASQDSGLPLLKSDTSQDVMEIHLNSLEVGREDDNYFIALSGTIDLTANVPGLGPVLPKGIEVKKLIIWQDGTLELEGGGLSLPSSVNLQAGPVDFSVTGIHLGSTQTDGRQYRYIGFDGGIGIDPGGVDAQGDGIKYFYTTDGGEFDHFLRVAGIGIDLIIPSDASESSAQLILNGYLAVKNPENGNDGTEYAGNVEFILPDAGIAGSAAMRLNPDKPAFIIDAGLEFDNPIPLGSTGLGFYGFRGLFGRHYTVSQQAAGLDPGNEDKWWEYYKAEVPPTNSEGVHVGKFSDEDPGFSVGAGASIATTEDSGYTFSSKIFFMLGHPGGFLLQGQANILGDRVGMSDNDPPFHALLAISDTSLEAGVGAYYQVPDSGSSKGSILDLDAEMQMAFFFNDATGWYINFGEDKPENKRIRAEIFSLFDGYAYLMINSSMIRAGAGIEWSLSKDYKRAKISAEAFMNSAGFIIYRPAQIGGHIALGGSAYVEVLRISLGLSVEAMLAAEAPRPFIVEGAFNLSIEVSLVFTSIEYSVNVAFEWRYEEELNMDEIDVITPPNGTNRPASAYHIPTGLDYQVAYSQNANENDLPPAPSSSSWDKSFGDDVTIPQDSFIDIEFNESVDPMEVKNIAGNNLNEAEYRIKVPPERGKSRQVEHTFSVNSVDIYFWDENAEEWKEYEVYKHMKPVIAHLDEVDESDLENIPDGFWQYNNPGRFNKLRLLAQDSFSFIRPGQDGHINWDAFKNRTLFLCENPVLWQLCFDWNDYSIPYLITPKKFFPGFSIEVKNDVIFLADEINGFGFNKGLKASSFENAKIEFYDIAKKVMLKTKTLGEGLFFKTYDEDDNLIEEVYKDASELSSEVILESDNNWIKSVWIENKHGIVLPEVKNTAELRIGKRQDFHSPQVLPGSLDEIMIFHKDLTEQEMNDVKSNSSNLPPDLIAHWKLEGNGNDSHGIHHGTAYNTITDQDGKYGEAMEFNGSNSVIKVPHDEDLILENTNYTITFWIKTTYDDQEERDVRVILDKRARPSGSYYGYSVYLYLGKIGFQIGDGAYTNVLGERYVSDDEWHFVAIAVNLINRKGKIFVDDLEEADAEFAMGFYFNLQKPWYLFEVCTQSKDNYIVTQNRPMQDDINSDIQKMKNAIEKSTQPVWRPYTKYAIRIKTEDKAEAGSDNEQYERTHFFGFKTSGPIGHFHNTDDRYQELENEDNIDEYPLNDLQHYIDYEHSYPNARGKLNGAKPLYYNDPQLYLAFKRPYVHAMFGDWPHDDLKNVYSDLKLRIFDPENNEANLEPTWKLNDYDFNRYSDDLNFLNRALQHTHNCTPFSSINQRFTLNAAFTPPALKPNKLYSAEFEAVTQIQGENQNVQVVHHYNFKTSKYKDFNEHINSIKLSDSNGESLKAIFTIHIDIDQDQYSLLKNIIFDNIEEDSGLRIDYAHIFDRVWGAGLELTSMESAETTEVNIIAKDNKIIAFLLRSPEPFFRNDISEAFINDHFYMENEQHHNNEVNTDFELIFSVDRSSVFITNVNVAIDPGNIKIMLSHIKPGNKPENGNNDEVSITFNTNDYGEFVQHINN